MQLIRTIRLLLTFYKGFCVASFLITGICCFLYWEYGERIWEILLCFKLLTLLMIYFFINSYKPDQFYYYRNLRLSKWMLWSVVFAFDIALYLFALNQITPPDA